MGMKAAQSAAASGSNVVMVGSNVARTGSKGFLSASESTVEGLVGANGVENGKNETNIVINAENAVITTDLPQLGQFCPAKALQWRELE